MPIKLKKTVSTSAVTGNSVLFNGSNQYLSIANNAVFDFGTGSFTIEGWINPTLIDGTYRCVFSIGNPVQIYARSGTLEIYFNDGDDTLTYIVFGANGPLNAITANTWAHFAVVRDGTTFTAYINGVAGTPTTGVSAAVASTSTGVVIGNILNTYPFSGYISNLRVVKGTALYTSNFTPSTSPLTAIANTSLLTCQSPTIIDGSTNNFTITNNNAATVSSAVVPFSSTFSVFKLKKNNANPVAPYSVQFNGTNQSLSVANNAAFDFGTGDFTIEGWIYSTSSKEYGILVGRWGGYAVNGNWSYAIRQGAAASQKYEFAFATNSSTVIIINALNTFSLNTWYHLAAVRNGTTFTFYVNGVSQGTTTNANAVFAGTTNLTVGGANNTTDLMNGYASNVRIVKGTALYTASFTAPTTPLTAITNTSLLTCNAATIVDASSNNFTITNNNTATVSSTITPFTASISTNKFKLRQVSYSPYMIATGGDLITTSGSYKIHTFTTVGTSSFVVSNIGNNLSVECLIVGGGGGGGGRAMAGGGGGGGVVYTSSAFLAIGSFSAIVGAGGIAATGMQASSGQNGGSTSFTYNGITTTALGGGGGATEGYVGLNGANGGGGTNGNGAGGAGVGGGFPGGSGSAENYLTRGCGGGGGGAGGAGVRGMQAIGGNGGIGAIYNITGSAYYGGGGGGGGNTNAGGATAGAGGLGGGGLGGRTSPGTAGTANTGGGGGGGGYTNTTGASETNGGNGGSGIILIKYRYTD